MKNILFLFCLIFVFHSCTKYDPLYPSTDNGQPEIAQDLNDMTYIVNNDVYILNSSMTVNQRLTNSPSSEKTACALADSYDRVAYLDRLKTPIILDMEGNVLETLSQHSNADHLFWYNGSETLCILRGNQIYFYGVPLNLSTNPFQKVLSNGSFTTEIESFFIDENLNIAYTYRQRRVNSNSQIDIIGGIGVHYPLNTSQDKITDVYESDYNPNFEQYRSVNYQEMYDIRMDGNQISVVSSPRVFHSSFSSQSNVHWNLSTGRVLDINNSDKRYYMKYYASNGNISADIGATRSANGTIVKTYFELNGNGSVSDIQLYSFPNDATSKPIYIDWKPNL